MTNSNVVTAGTKERKKKTQKAPGNKNNRCSVNVVWNDRPTENMQFGGP